MAAAELAAFRQGEPRGGMEGPAEAVPQAGYGAER